MRLYGSTGFPQQVQGKRGENYGESRRVISIFIFYNLQRIEVEQPVLGEWFIPQNVPCVPSLLERLSCQMVQVRRTRLELEGSAAHLKTELRFRAETTH